MQEQERFAPMSATVTWATLSVALLALLCAPWKSKVGHIAPAHRSSGELVGDFAAAASGTQSSLEDERKHFQDAAGELNADDGRWRVLFRKVSNNRHWCAVICFALVLELAIIAKICRCVRWRLRKEGWLPTSQQAFKTEVEVYMGSVAQFSVDSLLALYIFRCGRKSKTIPDHVYLNVMQMVLEPRGSAPHQESLECLPEDLRRGFKLHSCTLGTTLGIEPLACRLGNMQVWTASAETHLTVALPRGAPPWGRGGTLAVWFGRGSRYLPTCPAGPPVIKLPISQLTAIDHQNNQLLLEFSFERRNQVMMRPAELHNRSGTLLRLTFPDSGEALAQVSKLTQDVLGACRIDGTPAADVTPGLPNCGRLVPSRFYSRKARQVADLLWGVVNIAFLCDPIWKIYQLGPYGLGFDGILKLCMSRPQVAKQPITKIAQHVVKALDACRRVSKHRTSSRRSAVVGTL